MKIFTTQVIGRLQRIDEQEYEIEDSARVLAQALVGDGNIYIYAEEELDGVFLQAKFGQDSVKNVERLTKENFPTLSLADRVVLVSRTITNTVVSMAENLRRRNIPFVAMCSVNKQEENPLEDLADVFINLHIDKGLIPTESGSRVGFPHLLAALFVFQQITLTLDEIIEDY